MTAQQINYMRYQQMRQSAMRAFVAKAGSVKPQEPVPPVPPPPPPVTTWHVSLSAVEAGTDIPLGATVSIQEYSGHDPEVPGREVHAAYNVSADIQPGNWIRIRANDWFDDRGFSKFYVNGTRTDPQPDPETYSVFADVELDSDDTKILAVYNSLP